MKETNLAIINDESLKILMEEFLGREIGFFEYKAGSVEELLVFIEENGIDVVVVDKELYNIKNTLSVLKENHIKVIYAGFNTTIKELKEYVKRKEIYEYIEKSNYTEIETILTEIKSAKTKKNKISFTTESSSEVVISIEDIIYIHYDRETRRGVIVSEKGEFFSKKNMSELESFFANYQKFLRIDRGTIINIDKIFEIDYRNEYIKFDNNKKISVGAKTLRSFRKNISKWEDGN